MVLIHNQKDRKLAPAKDATEDIHKLAEEDHDKKSSPTAQVINHSQERGWVLITARYCPRKNEADFLGRWCGLQRARTVIVYVESSHQKPVAELPSWTMSSPKPRVFVQKISHFTRN